MNAERRCFPGTLIWAFTVSDRSSKVESSGKCWVEKSSKWAILIQSQKNLHQFELSGPPLAPFLYIFYNLLYIMYIIRLRINTTIIAMQGCLVPYTRKRKRKRKYLIHSARTIHSQDDRNRDRNSHSTSGLCVRHSTSHFHSLTTKLYMTGD